MFYTSRADENCIVIFYYYLSNNIVKHTYFINIEKSKPKYQETELTT